MGNKMEFWLAFAENDLTCEMSLSDGASGPRLEVILSGTLTPDRLYVGDLITGIIENTPSAEVILNIRALAVVCECSTNDDAINLLLQFLTTCSTINRKLHIIVDDGCVKEGLARFLDDMRYRTVDIAPSSAPFLPVARNRPECGFIARA